MNLKEAKTWLRKYLKAERQKLSRVQVDKKSFHLASKVIASSQFKKSKVLAVFISMENEVNTSRIIEAAWKKKKTVLIPMTDRGFTHPYFAIYKKGDILHQNKYSIYEFTDIRKTFDWSKIDLILVPGLGFDRHGHRLGYGGGVYDRLIKKTPQADHVGLFFREQKLYAIPYEKHDQKLTQIMTD